MVASGGVAANKKIIDGLNNLALENDMNFSSPPIDLCTDNAAMIGAAAWRRYQNDGPSNLGTGADPNLRIPE